MKSLPSIILLLFVALSLGLTIDDPTKHDPHKRPTKRPTKLPTKRPTKLPNKRPTKRSAKRSTKKPTSQPTSQPTNSPSYSPSYSPTFFLKTSDCPAGSRVTTGDECYLAYNYINALTPSPFKFTAKRGLVLLSISETGVPKDCSIQFQGEYVENNLDQSPHFNPNSASLGSRFNVPEAGEFQAICQTSIR